MLEPEALKTLKRGRSLLAFSGGIDSTALYHLLQEKGVAFDIALVNYRTRPQSDREAEYAEALAARDGRRCFLHTAPLSSDSPGFEAQARRLRYRFFESLIQKHRYNHLVTAHQLDDRLTWTLMQLCRGCGLAEMVGMLPVEPRQGYTLVRPLLNTPKERLKNYLDERNIPYFLDTSNDDPRYTRNLFRQEVTDFLIARSAEGIARTFRYLQRDLQELVPPLEEIFACRSFHLLAAPVSLQAAVRHIDTVLKAEGYLLSAPQREILRDHPDQVVGGRWAVVQAEQFIWIAPFLRTPLSKRLRERCRSARIPPKIRPYLVDSGCLEALLSRLDRLRSS